MRDVISECNSEIESLLAFYALTLFLCSGSSVHVDCILPFEMLCFREDGVCSMHIWWWLNVRESSFRVCSELCPVCFPIVRECASVLL